MARDSSLQLRRAVLAALKGDSGVTALVPAASIHPQAPRTVPSWPFVRYGTATGVPRLASCVDGAEYEFRLHAFAKDRGEAGAIVETAEDHAHRIGAALSRSIGGKRLSLDGGSHAALRVERFQVIQDGPEAGAFHAVVDLSARIRG